MNHIWTRLEKWYQTDLLILTSVIYPGDIYTVLRRYWEEFQRLIVMQAAHQSQNNITTIPYRHQQMLMAVLNSMNTCNAEWHVIVFFEVADVTEHVTHVFGTLHAGIPQSWRHVVDDVDTLTAQFNGSLRPEMDQVRGHVASETGNGAVEFQRVSGDDERVVWSNFNVWNATHIYMNDIYQHCVLKMSVIYKFRKKIRGSLF